MIEHVTVESLSMMGFAAGMLGGLASAINAVFGNFKKVPARPLSVAQHAIRSRALFLTFRLLVAGILGIAITFWFAPDVISRSLALPKLVFIQFMVGFVGSISFRIPFLQRSAA